MNKFAKDIIRLVAAALNGGAMAIVLANIESERIPAHYGFSGEVDRYGSKWELMITAVIPIVLAIGFLIYDLAVKNRDKEGKNARITTWAFDVISVFFIIFTWVVSAPSLKGDTRLSSNWLAYFGFLFAGLFIVLGSGIGKVKQNALFGIRTAAALRSATVWKRTHRLSGYLWVIGGGVGLVFSILALLTDSTSSLLVIIGLGIELAVCLVVPCVYSEVLYARLKRQGTLDNSPTDGQESAD